MCTLDELIAVLAKIRHDNGELGTGAGRIRVVVNAPVGGEDCWTKPELVSVQQESETDPTLFVRIRGGIGA